MMYGISRHFVLLAGLAVVAIVTITAVVSSRARASDVPDGRGAQDYVPPSDQPSADQLTFWGKTYERSVGIGLLSKMLDSPDLAEQRRGADMAGQCKGGLIGTGIVETLETLCANSPDIGARRASAEALYKIHDPRSRPLLRSQIRLSHDPFVRLMAAGYLAKEWRKDEAEDVIQGLLACLAIDQDVRRQPGIAGTAFMHLRDLAKQYGVAEPAGEWYIEAPEKRVELVKQWWAANKDAVIQKLPEGPQPQKPEGSTSIPDKPGWRSGVLTTTRAASQPSSRPSITTQPAATASKPAT